VTGKPPPIQLVGTNVVGGVALIAGWLITGWLLLDRRCSAAKIAN
jgi:hypothetical protein